MTHPYDDILHKERPLSASHPPMSRRHRAAQFAPFAALSGHDEAIRETARLTEREIVLSDGEKDVLDRALRAVAQHLPCEVRAVRFQADAYKEGGRYTEQTGVVRRVDAVRQVLCLVGGEEWEFANLIRLEMTTNPAL